MVKATKRNKDVEKQLKEHFRNNELVTSFLMIGMENSGKHTVLKQLERIFNRKYESNLEEYTSIIKNNLVSSISALCSFIHYNNINECKETIKEIQSEMEKDITKSNLCELCEKVYRNESVYELFNQSLVDYTREVYFLDNMERIKKEDYIPTNEDILYASFPKNVLFLNTKNARKLLK